jgi:hypothetical protein
MGRMKSCNFNLMRTILHQGGAMGGGYGGGAMGGGYGGGAGNSLKICLNPIVQ